MLFKKQLLFCAFALLYSGEVLARSDDLDLTLLNGLKPHGVVIDADVHRLKFKRDSPAEIEVLDSDTLPVEDIVSSSESDGSGSSNSGSTVYTTSGDAAGSSSFSSSSSDKINVGSDRNADDSSNLSDSSNQSPFLMSISMIAISEIGDKTFLISALMAMRHSRMLVFSASFTSLAFMTILSGVVGHVLPTLISQRVTQFLAAILFVVFGIKLTKEGLEMSKDLGVEEELAEVEDELTISDRAHESENLEAGRPVNSNSAYGKTSSSSYKQAIANLGEQFRSIASSVISPLWVQVFVMIFLGEWGDRSQIATIAMAAGSNYWAVICGAVVGHGICTLAAVVGGKMLASRISMRSVTLGGAFAFFIFAILYFYDAYYGVTDA